MIARLQIGVRNKGEDLGGLPAHYRADRKIVMIAVSANGLALRYAGRAQRRF